MGHRIRYFPEGVRFFEVITKCVGDEMLMRPDSLAVFLIAQALTGALLEHDTVKVIAFCFVSNHYHLILMVTGDDGRPISPFLKTLNQQISEDLNVHRGRGGHFVKGKPKVNAILEDAHLQDRLTYTHAQSVRHDLVERVEDWPGLCSFRAVCDGKPSLAVSYLDEHAWREAGARSAEIPDYTSTVEIPITPIPKWEALSERELRAARRAHERSVRDRERDKAAERQAAGKHRGLGDPARLAKIDPFSRTAGPPKRKPQPWAHGSKDAVEGYRRAYSEVLAAYRAASESFRATRVLGEFPKGTFPPWGHWQSEVTT